MHYYHFYFRGGDYAWAFSTLFCVFLPLIMSLIIYCISRIRRESTITEVSSTSILDESENSKFEKFISKCERMNRVLRSLPIVQSFYHVSVLRKLWKIADEIDKKKELLKNFETKLKLGQVDMTKTRKLSRVEFQNLRNKLQEYDDFISRNKEYRNVERHEAILKIPDKISARIQVLKQANAKLLSSFCRTKVLETFFESAPQFILQCYILVQRFG